METITVTLQSHPELAVFLMLALGFSLGRIQIGTFKIGMVLGTLFAGVIIGQFAVEVPSIVKTIFFDLFLFATGYKVGPQFFQGLKKNALPQLLLTLVITVSCLFFTILISKLLGYDVGIAAGLLAGGFSESTVIGTAADTIMQLNLPDAEKTRLINNIPVAYATTYLIGATSFVFFLTTIAPRLLGISLVEESQKLSEKLTGTTEHEPGIDSAYQRWIIRAYTITNPKWLGLTISEFEKVNNNLRIIVQRIRREGNLIDPTPDFIIRQNDVLVIMAQHGIVLTSLADIGPEVLDEELLNFPLAHMEITVTKKFIEGKTIGELRDLKIGEGLLIDKLTREYHEMPFDLNTILQRGDVLKVSGKISHIENAAKKAGFLDRLNIETDIIFVCLGIVIGGIIGLLSVSVKGIPITLTTSGGALGEFNNLTQQMIIFIFVEL